MLEQIKNAGAVFIGPHSPVAVGDYIAGPNHVLPTGGTSRFSSPLGVYDFVKHQSIIGYIKVNDHFDYHMIETWNPSLFAFLPGVKKTRMRKERYDEMMLRMAEEYLEEQEKV